MKQLRSEALAGKPPLRIGQWSQIPNRSSSNKDNRRQRKSSTKVRWQEMVLKLHITAPLPTRRPLLSKENDGPEEVGECSDNFEYWSIV